MSRAASGRARATVDGLLDDPSALAAMRAASAALARPDAARDIARELLEAARKSDGALVR